MLSFNRRWKLWSHSAYSIHLKKNKKSKHSQVRARACSESCEVGTAELGHQTGAAARAAEAKGKLSWRRTESERKWSEGRKGERWREEKQQRNDIFALVAQHVFLLGAWAEATGVTLPAPLATRMP